MSDEQREEKYGEELAVEKLDLRKGLFVGVLAQVFGAIAVTIVQPMLLLFVGAIQLTYVVPTLIYANAKGRPPQYLKGIILIAAGVFLLNAACFGIGFASMAFSGPWYN